MSGPGTRQSVEIEPSHWVMSHIAWNQVVSGMRLWAKMVAALSEVCRPQVRHS
jgi:hypothetical protein